MAEHTLFAALPLVLIGFGCGGSTGPGKDGGENGVLDGGIDATEAWDGGGNGDIDAHVDGGGHEFSHLLEKVVVFADNVLEHGRDVYGGVSSPLFVDGINTITGEPAVWRYDGKEYIISNFASQQNLMRVLVGLSNMTGDNKYREAGEDAAAYMFSNFRADCGLLYWGGHQIIDLGTMQNVGDFDANCHEFKNNFPFYEFLWEVDQESTREFIRALWNAHILDWSLLDMNRHGSYHRSMGTLWSNTFDDPPPFFEGSGLTFINAGSDMILAAAMLYALDPTETGALAWSNLLAEQYVKARHPATNLGVYQYSKPRRINTPPEDGPLTGELTYSSYGDRAENQFGAVYGDTAREGWVLWGGRVKSIYVAGGLVRLELAERLGAEGEALLSSTVDGLKSHFAAAYDADTNRFRPMWADGTDLTGQTYPRTGYYGSEGTPFSAVSADDGFLFVYARAYRLTGDEALWNAIRAIAQNLGLGDLGESPGVNTEPNLATSYSRPDAVFALCEIAGSAGYHQDYITLAERVAENMVAARFHGGYFLPSERHYYAFFNTSEPLALLTLEATRNHTPEAVPVYSGGRGYIHGRYDGYGRTYDSVAIWGLTRTLGLYVDDSFYMGQEIGRPDYANGAYLFDGVSDAVVFDESPAFEDGDRFSIVVKAQMFDDNRFLCAYRYHLSRTGFRTRGTDSLQVNLSGLGEEEHVLAVTYDGAAGGGGRELRIYVDGVLADTATGTGSPLSSYDSHSLSAGRTEHSGGVHSNVRIAEGVRIYNRVLSPQEVADISADF